MFYCDKCAEKNEWPNEWWRPKSFGRCEMCGKTNECTDIPSSALPDAEPPRCGADLDFDGEIRVRYNCSLPRNHVGAHEAWTNNVITDDMEKDCHARWVHIGG